MTHHSIIQFRRAEIEARIEQLIELLDLLDGDSDLEDGGDDEPWLGGAARRCGREITDDLEMDTADFEPWLGWTVGIDQSDCERVASCLYEPDREEDADVEYNGDEFDHSVGIPTCDNGL